MATSIQSKNCANCGSPAVKCIDSTGGTLRGEFTEVHQCESCGAEGEINGDNTDQPEEWNRTGEVFTGY